ncbi:rfrA family pentapeptide repeat [Crocosphaera subtropica ATCC 51142]|uniref:RfrA family pentapeptide repeat n=1 Tax=Crocosphaera subtropica (strain ATCC 51142 / BH68) TaxID=43989 RepID=B1X1A0_CROS5|nr:pentapeptide repeat-containing protein [Crocosphaera subtropica]ACB51329.1 rfrA family pentapeptide repeat [Crocosphaera subtropica ATCC 51142]
MKASELINLYNARRRDFPGECLRGQNFAGKDLSGANFRGCDIRGANFTGATLIEANFSNATAGLQKQWMMGLLLVAFLLIALSSVCSAFVGYLVSLILNSSSVDNQVAGWVSLGILLIFCLISYWKGLGRGLAAVAITVAVAFTAAAAGSLTAAIALTVSFAVAIAVVVAVAIAMAVAVTEVMIIGIAVAVAVVGGIVEAIASAVAVPLAIAIVAAAGALALFASFVAYRAMKGDPRDAWIRTLAVAFAAIGGTTFRKANLTDANFSQTRLKSTDFRDAILTRTCFKNAQKLDRIRPENTLLSQTNVKDLLMTGYGYKKSYVNANLQGANLDGANLNEANLKQCNLNDASLRGTNLEWTNLTQVSAINTNFTHCNLTGACIEAWNIDQTTILDNVDCQYLFLLEKPGNNGTRERRPHDPNKMFQPGDFEKLYQKIINTVELFLKNGINLEAFKQAFDKIVEENPNISYDNIQGIEKKGNDVLVTVEVPEDTDKADIQNTFDEVYELRLKAATATKLLEAEKEHKKDIIKVVDALKSSQTNIINENKAMTNSSDNSQNIQMRDINATNSVVNLGEISGQVSNNIQQIPDYSEDEKPSIKQLLSQLKTAIETEKNLDDETKADALDSVNNITEAAKNPEDSNLKKLAKLSKNAILGIVSTLPTATTLVVECNKLLPAISQLLGL